MRSLRMITAVDSHTEGEPARVVTGGIPHVPGATMREKWNWARQNLEETRRFLMYEPRGSNIQSGSIITAPASAEADVGVLFIEVSGFLPLCGHMTIATCTVLVEMGMVKVTEPITPIVLDTPVGLVRAEVRVEEGVAKDVTFRGVPSFLLHRDVAVDVPDLGRIVLDIAWGGNFYAIVKAEQISLELSPDRVKEIVRAGTQIRQAIAAQIAVAHPTNKEITRCTHVRFVAPPIHPQASTRNAVVYGAEGVDRSPCGTGTSAEVAARVARGDLALNHDFVSESILGTLFFGRAVEETVLGGIPAIVPTVRGSAYITGIQQFVLHPNDPWPAGFVVGPRSEWI